MYSGAWRTGGPIVRGQDSVQRGQGRAEGWMGHQIQRARPPLQAVIIPSETVEIWGGDAWVARRQGGRWARLPTLRLCGHQAGDGRHTNKLAPWPPRHLPEPAMFVFGACQVGCLFFLSFGAALPVHLGLIPARTRIRRPVCNSVSRICS